MIYANPSLAQTRIREAVKYRLLQITMGNGYKNTIVNVLDDPPSTLSSIERARSIVPIWCKTNLVGETNSELALESLLWGYALAEEQSNVSLSIENLAGDIMACIGRNPYLVHEDGVETCQQVKFDSMEPFGNKDTRPKVGVKIGLRVKWSVRTNDPSIIGSAL
jgi:hypothetical protein